MEAKSILDHKVLVTLSVFFLTLLFILFEYFNGGVITHHLLAREDLPGISNWWGLVTVPLLSWISILLISKRRDAIIKLEPAQLENYDAKILKAFLFALLFGITASLMWKFNLANILRYFILTPILFAFFKPVYLPEYLLGFVIGMQFTFGGILPIIVGTVLLILCFLVHKLTRVIMKTILLKN